MNQQDHWNPVDYARNFRCSISSIQEPTSQTVINLTNNPTLPFRADQIEFLLIGDYFIPAMDTGIS